MTDTATAPTPKAKKAASKPKKPSAHPKYSEMVAAAIGSLKERGGSSRQAILKYILKNYNVGKEEKSVNAHLKLALKAGVKKGSLKQAKGTGAAGSFRLGEVKKAPKKAAKKAPKPAAAKKKPAAKKPAAAAKKATKKAGTPKKKKVAAKKATPKKKPAAAKKKATPKKKPAAKKAAAKKPAAKKAPAKK